jgi:acyl-homoserine lactone acylase PvdQ
VDGSDPATEWQGFHSLAERPQVLNPPSGFIQNCNSSPFMTTVGDNPKPEDFPPYMVGARDTDYPRSRMARRILDETESFTFEEFGRTPSTNYLLETEVRLPDLFAAFNGLDAGDPIRQRLEPAIAELEGWDRTSRVDDVATSLFVLWYERAILPAVRSGAEPGDPLAALGEVMNELESDWGTWSIPFGEINRLQRVPGAAAGLGSDPAFSDDRESVATAGTSGWMGTVNTFYTVKPEGSRRRYGRSGRSNTAVVEFADRVRARSIMPFGNSIDPSSPHFVDQMPIYAAGGLKPMWFYRDELETNVEREYHPGEE